MHDDGFTYFPSILFILPIVYYLLFNADRLLLLEEPTNYLDEGGGWGFLQYYKRKYSFCYFTHDNIIKAFILDIIWLK